MVKLKGKFTAQRLVLTDPFLVDFCQKEPKEALSGKEKVRLFRLYEREYTGVDVDVERDKEEYRNRKYVNWLKWPFRVSVYSSLGVFYSWIGSWYGLPRSSYLLTIPLSLLSFCYLDYRMDFNSYLKLAEKNEPQMTKWLCAHTPGPS